jgi:hypothetical protein
MEKIGQLHITKALHQFNSNISYWITETEEGTCFINQRK